MVPFAVCVAVVLLLEEQLFVSEICREGDRSYAQAGEAILKPIPSGEGPGVAPGLAVSILAPSVTRRDGLAFRVKIEGGLD